jgi:hypothetical protein
VEMVTAESDVNAALHSLRMIRETECFPSNVRLFLLHRVSVLTARSRRKCPLLETNREFRPVLEEPANSDLSHRSFLFSTRVFLLACEVPYIEANLHKGRKPRMTSGWNSIPAYSLVRGLATLTNNFSE